MKLTRKLTLAISCVILLVMVTNAWIRVRREVELFESDMRRDHRTLGRAVAGAAARVWQRGDEREAFAIVEDANLREGHLLIRWVWPDAPEGDPRRPAVRIPRLTRAQERVVKQLVPGEHIEAIYTYVPIRGPRPAALEIRETLAEEQGYVRRTILRASFYTAVLIAVCGAIVLLLGAVLVGRPARRLVEQARRIGAGDLSARLELPQRDEMGTLSLEMNRMADRLVAARERADAETAARLAAVEQMRHAERLTTVGKLAAGIAHEVGTPLNVVIGHAQLIVEEYPASSSARENADIVIGQARRVTAIIRQLLDFARRRAPARTDEDVVVLVRQATSVLGALAHAQGVDLELALPPEEIHAPVDAGQLQQVLTNLVMNAIHAMSAGGTLTVGAERNRPKRQAEDGLLGAEQLRLYVRDRGSGIPAEVLPRIFEPFFTTKDTGQGTGLGLSVAYGIVKEHGGWIDVETEVGQGSCFSVYLPMERGA